MGARSQMQGHCRYSRSPGCGWESETHAVSYPQQVLAVFAGRQLDNLLLLLWRDCRRCLLNCCCPDLSGGYCNSSLESWNISVFAPVSCHTASTAWRTDTERGAQVVGRYTEQAGLMAYLCRASSGVGLTLPRSMSSQVWQRAPAFPGCTLLCWYCGNPLCWRPSVTERAVATSAEQRTYSATGEQHFATGSVAAARQVLHNFH